MLALATCYCNDLYREAERLRIPIEGLKLRLLQSSPVSAWLPPTFATVRSSSLPSVRRQLPNCCAKPMPWLKCTTPSVPEFQSSCFASERNSATVWRRVV